jgi:hypothetical protein
VLRIRKHLQSDYAITADGFDAAGDDAAVTGTSVTVTNSAGTDVGTYTPAVVDGNLVATIPADDLEIDIYTAVWAATVGGVTDDLTGPSITVTGVEDTVAGPLAGSVAAGFTLPTTNDPSLDHELSLAAGSVSSEPLADTYNGLFLQPTADQTAELVAYYAARGMGVGDPVVTDSYPESNQNDSDRLASDRWNRLGQSFTAAQDGTLDSAAFYLHKYGSPTGYAYAELYAHEGTYGESSIGAGPALATSGGLDVSTLTSSFTMCTFEFDNSVSLTAGTHYVIVVRYVGGDIDNGVRVGVDSSSPTHDGNTVATWNDDEWYAYPVEDTPFYVVVTPPSPYLTYLNAAATGTVPFVYLKADGTTLSLVDGAKYDIQGTDAPMTVPDDFPIGAYTVAGTVADAAGNTTVVTFKLVVAGDRIGPEITFTGVEDDGLTIEFQTRFEVVGDLYFDPYELRSWDSDFSSPTDYPDADIEAARTWAEDRFENAAERAFVVRGRTDTVYGDGSQRLELPNMDLREVSAITVDGVVLDTSLVTVRSHGYVHGPVWAKDSTVKVSYTYGLTDIPAPVKEAVMLLAAWKLVPSNLRANAVSESTDVGFYRLSYATPGGKTGLLEVDAVAADFGHRRPRVG